MSSADSIRWHSITPKAGAPPPLALYPSTMHKGSENLIPGNKQEGYPIEPFRAKFIKMFNADEIDFSELARRMGQTRKETSYVQRMLGLRPAREVDKDGTIYYRFRSQITYKTATKLARALDIDPVDLGL